MIAIFECREYACFAGVGWYPELLAAFLAVWMPVNLITYLLILFYGLCQGYKATEEARSLKRLLLSTVLTIPFVVFVFVMFFVQGLLEAKKKAKLIKRFIK